MTPLEAKALLIRVMTKLVTPKLEQGGFIPFGALLGQNREVQLLMPKSMKRNVARDGLDTYFVQTIRKAMAGGKYITACWCADVRAQTNGEALIPALLVHIEHADSFSQNILIPYRKNEGGKIAFDEPTSEPTQYQIFSSQT